MWNAKGRSGYGDTNLDGTYDDVILGVSPNGRQYRNEATLEPRALSGWAYWNLRKQITPEQEIPEELYARNETESMSHTLANGQANLAKYADPVTVKKVVKKAPLRDRISLADRHFNRIEALSLELDSEWKAGNIDAEEYYELRAKMDVRLDKAWKRLEKDNGWSDENTEQAPSHTFSSNAAAQPEFIQEKKENSVKNRVSKAVQLAKHDAVIFITGSATLLMGLKFLF